MENFEDIFEPNLIYWFDLIIDLFAHLAYLRFGNIGTVFRKGLIG